MPFRVYCQSAENPLFISRLIVRHRWELAAVTLAVPGGDWNCGASYDSKHAALSVEIRPSGMADGGAGNLCVWIALSRNTVYFP